MVNISCNLIEHVHAFAFSQYELLMCVLVFLTNYQCNYQNKIQISICKLLYNLKYKNIIVMCNTEKVNLYLILQWFNL